MYSWKRDRNQRIESSDAIWNSGSVRSNFRCQLWHRVDSLLQPSSFLILDWFRRRDENVRDTPFSHISTRQAFWNGWRAAKKTHQESRIQGSERRRDIIKSCHGYTPYPVSRCGLGPQAWIRARQLEQTTPGTGSSITQECLSITTTPSARSDVENLPLSLPFYRDNESIPSSLVIPFFLHLLNARTFQVCVG